jgi:hypothetical protein
MTEMGWTALKVGIGVVLAVMAARMLWRTGTVLLSEAFPEKDILASVVKCALVLSFSLICGAYVSAQAGGFWTDALRGFSKDQIARQEISTGDQQLCWMVALFGVNLLFHLFVLTQVRGRGRRRPKHGESILA